MKEHNNLVLALSSNYSAFQEFLRTMTPTPHCNMQLLQPEVCLPVISCVLLCTRDTELNSEWIISLGGKIGLKSSRRFTMNCCVAVLVAFRGCGECGCTRANESQDIEPT